jgi:hypothetical protein
MVHFESSRPLAPSSRGSEPGIELVQFDSSGLWSPARWLSTVLRWIPSSRAIFRFGCPRFRRTFIAVRVVMDAEFAMTTGPNVVTAFSAHEVVNFDPSPSGTL